MPEYTDEQFIEAMKAAVAEKGEDYVYPSAKHNTDSYGVVADDYHNEYGECMYSTPSGEPACIIGKALSYIDPDIVPGYGQAESADSLLKDLGFSDRIVSASGPAQSAQDEGLSWGDALEVFNEYLAPANN